jgi:hypothetical protein
MGIESDSRAGAVRVDPNSIVAKADDLTPNIQILSDAFNKGFVDTQQIMDRFSSKGIAQDEAATAKAKLATQEAQEIGPLKINAQKAQFDPGVVAQEQEVRIGAIDQKLAEQDALKKTRKQRDKIFQAQVGQGLDEITQHLPASSIAALNNQFPQLGAKFDDDGRVTNGDEVRARMPDILAHQRFLDSATDMTKQFENISVELPGGQKGIQTVWKGTNRPVPRAIVDAAIGAKEARFGAGFSENGTVPQPGEFAGVTPQGQGGSAVIQVERSSAPDTGGTFQPGTITESGVLVTGEKADQRGKPTEIQARGNKFFRRMAESEKQYGALLRGGYDPRSPKNVALRDALAITSKLPVLGSAFAGVYPDETFQADQVIKNFTSAILRDESGAAIRDDERAEYERMFFPVAGEPQSTSDSKAQQRASAAAALKQVADGTMDDASFEQIIEQLTGRQFPSATTLRGVTANSDSTTGAGPIVGRTNVATPKPSGILRVKPGDAIPPDAEWIWFEGEASPRRRRRTAPPQAPAPAATPSQPVIAPRELSLPPGSVRPQNPNAIPAPVPVGGIRG